MKNQSGMKNAVKLYFKQYFVFKGKSTRAEYWWVILFNFIITFILTLFLPILNDFYALLILIPSLSLLVRRYQDVGFTFKFSLIYMLFNIILVIIVMYQIIEMITPEMINDMYNNYNAFQNSLEDKFIMNSFMMNTLLILFISSLISLFFTLLPSKTYVSKSNNSFINFFIQNNQVSDDKPLIINVDLSKINEGMDESFNDDEKNN